ncbi:DCUN1D5 isoform 5 [Pongo abelii]|uniref:DCUN1D5 isoform 5 n=2 Tax=Pongo abelii TaxID=9601 RepID=A0A2J8XX77_PONAB|nr:DCUN1D5 isoform 5 [Pongo abelii]
MPVKKKRKSPGVAAAVAEDGGLKKCKISRYHLPPPFKVPSSLLCWTTGGKGVGPGLPGWGWRQLLQIPTPC